MKYLLNLLLFTALLAACQGSADQSEADQTPSKEEKESALYQEMMDIHDIVMPKMGTMSQLGQQLKAQLEKLEKGDDALKPQMEKIVADLSKADEGMMDWMHGVESLGKLRESKSHEEIMAYIEGEKLKIEGVQELTESSIETAQALLKQFAEADK